MRRAAGRATIRPRYPRAWHRAGQRRCPPPAWISFAGQEPPAGADAPTSATPCRQATIPGLRRRGPASEPLAARWSATNARNASAATDNVAHKGYTVFQTLIERLPGIIADGQPTLETAVA